MNKAIIKAQGIAKHYRIGTIAGRAKEKARDFLGKTGLLKKENTAEKASASEFWALRDVSFEIKQGETVGVIGKNGAGKSTLLKILSRITMPSAGNVWLRGRVASLLEAATGFHPELTGRENIYLSGAILGMKKADIRKKLDEIVDFSGIEKFIDTPSKRYSTGMIVRIGFAIAAHLEPDILLVDEVLAVGDFEFQKRCLGKMEEITGEGRTLLFVSHNMSAVRDLCPRSLYLNHGRVLYDGDSSEAISRHLGYRLGLSYSREWKELESAPSNEVLRLCSVRVLDAEGEASAELSIEKPFGVEICFSLLAGEYSLGTTLEIFSESGAPVFSAINNQDDFFYQEKHSKGDYGSTCMIPAHFLNEGIYRVNVKIWTGNYQNLVGAEEVLELYLEDGTISRKGINLPWKGLVRPIFSWENKRC